MSAGFFLLEAPGKVHIFAFFRSEGHPLPLACGPPDPPSEQQRWMEFFSEYITLTFSSGQPPFSIFKCPCDHNGLTWPMDNLGWAQSQLIRVLFLLWSLVSIFKVQNIKMKTFFGGELFYPLTVWTRTNSGNFFKRWEYQTTWPASWEICMQVRKQQLELDVELQTGSK